MRVCELIPGDVVGGHTFVTRTEHPIYVILDLVIWKMSDGSWSHDALDPRQEIGEAEPLTQEDRMRNLRKALLHS